MNIKKILEEQLRVKLTWLEVAYIALLGMICVFGLMLLASGTIGVVACLVRFLT